ncbi:MAG: S41 family peptidase [Eubacterium sp.]|nr:S41 family peptidase [Eubacterium sp.]
MAVNTEHNHQRLSRLSAHIRKNWKSFVAGMLTMAVIGSACFWAYLHIGPSSSPDSPSSLSAFRKTREIQEIIQKYYLNDADTQAETDSMYLGMVSGLEDKYSTYYTAEQYKAIKMSNDGQMKGIGITISKNEDRNALEVESVSDDSPAQKAEILEGDLIVTLNGESTADMTSSDAVKLIQNGGDTVTLTIEREGTDQKLDLTLTKETIKKEVVKGSMLKDKIGYIQIAGFNRLTSEQFGDALAQLQKEGMQGLVIDLRDNLGGLVSACCDTLRQFLPKGTLVYEQDRNGEERERTNDTDNQIDLPIVLLVNENTASASEMFTGAVLDYGVGIAVGSTTYGKGIEQDSYTLSDGSVLKITTTHYYTPKHNDINSSGITPNISVEQSEDSASDTVLDTASAVVREEISGKTVKEILKEYHGTEENYSSSGDDEDESVTSASS